jgi:hypothetical protein
VDHRRNGLLLSCAGAKVPLKGQELVGHRIGVLWPEHASYFLGRITGYSHEAFCTCSACTCTFTDVQHMRHL